MTELTDEIRTVIKNYAHAFWDDMRVSNENGHVVFWVDTCDGRQYDHDLGAFDNADEVVAAILASPEYDARPRVSAKRIAEGLNS